jgi:hypothetical protein
MTYTSYSKLLIQRTLKNQNADRKSRGNHSLFFNLLNFRLLARASDESDIKYKKASKDKNIIVLS